MRLEREKRFELSTLSLATRCSTTELFPLGFSIMRQQSLVFKVQGLKTA